MLLALPLTGHASLLEWLVTIMALSVVQAGLPFVHNGFSVGENVQALQCKFFCRCTGSICLISREQNLHAALVSVVTIPNISVLLT